MKTPTLTLAFLAVTAFGTTAHANPTLYLRCQVDSGEEFIELELKNPDDTNGSGTIESSLDDVPSSKLENAQANFTKTIEPEGTRISGFVSYAIQADTLLRAKAEHLKAHILTTTYGAFADQGFDDYVLASGFATLKASDITMEKSETSFFLNCRGTYQPAP